MTRPRKFRSRWGVWMRTVGPTPVTLFPMPPGCTVYPDYIDGRRQRWISAERSGDLMRAMMEGLPVSPNTVTSWVHGRTVPPKRVRDWIRRNAK